MEKKNENLTNEICVAIAKQLRKPVAEVTVNKKLKEDLNADSLDLVELMMNLEEQYHITIADEDLVKMQTIGDVVNYITKVMK
ncbi:MAG: acyl carrier protein [Eubacteriales bacterium]|nr:acyl carrier protein [Eubacteriales bacterium]